MSDHNETHYEQEHHGSASSYATQVSSLYDEFFGHAPDDSGLAHYEQELASGRSTEQVREELSQTSEFKERLHQIDPALWEQHYGSSTTGIIPTSAGSYATQVTSLYSEFFGHAPDDAGLAHYEQELASGKSTEQVREELSQTAEFKERLHQADPALWEQHYGSSTSGTIPTSAGSYATQVTSLYNEFFGHAPDDAGLALYGQELASGRSTEQVREELSQTAEFKERLHQVDSALWEQHYGSHRTDDVGLVGTVTTLQHDHFG